MSFSQYRHNRLQQELQGIGASSMYVRNTPNIEWLTGFENVFDEEQAHAMVVPSSGDEMAFHTDSRYSAACEREAEGTPIAVNSEPVAMAKWALSEWERNGKGSIAIEDSISLGEYRNLGKAFGSSPFVETSGLIVGLRAVKDASEIERLKAAQAVTDAAFAHMIGFIKPGMTERDVQLELDDYMMRHGAEALAFPSIVASGANGASPHAIVSDKVLESGECIVMDFGAKRDGYCSDMTRTVFLGEPEGKMLRAWETLRLANETVQDALEPGMTGREAHEMVLDVLEKGGFGGLMGHGLGHGVGIEIHEEPVLSPRNEKPLAVGNVVTVEPGIYLPGEFGMRLEDFGVITENGFDRFTKSTHDMVVM